MRQCEVCGRAQPERDELAFDERCECAIVRTPGILGGQWRLRDSRIFARTLLALWFEFGRSKSAAVEAFAKFYPDRTSEQVHRAIDWLSTHHERVALEALKDKLGELDERLMEIALYCQKFGIDRATFEEQAREAVRAAWRGAKLGEVGR